MTTHSSRDTIGNAIAIDMDVGDEVTVTTPKRDKIEATVIEIPDDVPVEAYQTKEVIAETDDGDILALYAQTTKMRPMRVDYNVYAVRFPDNGTDDEDLGEIEVLTVE